MSYVISGAGLGGEESDRTSLVALPLTNMPWKKHSGATLAWQISANMLIQSSGASITPLAEDGFLGPLTCAAASALSVPSPPQCTPANRPKAPAPAPAPAPTEEAVYASAGPNWLYIGGGIGLVALGIAVVMAKGK